MEQAEKDAIRGKVDVLIERAKDDSGFLERFRTDTVAVLVEGGIDADTAQTINDTDIGFADEGDVTGHMKPGNRYCRFTDDGLGCFITLCTYIPWTY